MNVQEGATREQLQFGLRPGELYRISYALGSPEVRRVTRSLAVFGGASARRQWDGTTVWCLDFTRPQGRPLSLVGDQLVDARLATLNEHGQVVLVDDPGRARRRLTRRRVRRVA